MERRTLYAIIAIIIIVGGIGGGWVLWTIYMQPPPENPYGVAIVFGTGGLGDLGFNDLCNDGAIMARDTHGIEYTYSEPQAIAEFEPLLRQYALHIGYSTPYALIIGIGFEIADAMTAVAADFPEQNFAIVDVYWLNTTLYPNIVQVNFDEEEGSALVGALAGLRTTQDMIAFVGGKDEPLIHKFAAGYFFGANITNPTLMVTNDTSPNTRHSWVGAWDDPDTAQTQTEGHFSAGADICFAAAGGSGVGVLDAGIAVNGTLAYPVWTIGVDAPQMYLGVPPSGTYTTILTSMLKRVDIGVFKVISEATVYANFTGGVRYFGLAEGGVGWELNNDLLAPGYKVTTGEQDILADIATAIINGSIVVPTDFNFL
ncbi:MAG: BMP family protein [Promethearchaeota archaeon]